MWDTWMACFNEKLQTLDGPPEEKNIIIYTVNILEDLRGNTVQLWLPCNNPKKFGSKVEQKLYWNTLVYPQIPWSPPFSFFTTIDDKTPSNTLVSCLFLFYDWRQNTLKYPGLLPFPFSQRLTTKSTHFEASSRKYFPAILNPSSTGSGIFLISLWNWTKNTERWEQINIRVRKTFFFKSSKVRITVILTNGDCSCTLFDSRTFYFLKRIIFHTLSNLHQRQH